MYTLFIDGEAFVCFNTRHEAVEFINSYGMDSSMQIKPGPWRTKRESAFNVLTWAFVSIILDTVVYALIAIG